MNLNFVTPILIAFGVNVVLSPIIIPFLTRLKFGQYIRDDGPRSHLKKAGTPTMGGIIILTSILITSLFYVNSYPEIIPILFVTLGFGLIGFLDDFIKIVMKRSLGLRAWQKLVAQILVTAIFGYYLLNYTNVETSMLIPFARGATIPMGIWFVPVLFVVMIGTVNSVNLTDGLDGLASSITVLVAAFFSVVSIGVRSGIEPITCAAVGSLLGFLLFNSHPARVFMGDTGSLALGGFVAATAYMLQMPLFLLIVGFVYVVETTSVMLQVLYYKKTKKRLFKMAPIHHHFELSGWPETKVVSVFSIMTAILCFVGLLAL